MLCRPTNDVTVVALLPLAFVIVELQLAARPAVGCRPPLGGASKIGGRAPHAPGCPRGHLRPRRACQRARRADAPARSKGTLGAHLRLTALTACAGRDRGAKSVGERRALPNGAALVGNSGLGASIKLGAVPAYDVSGGSAAL